MQPRYSQLIQFMHDQIRPAVGCTEPAAVAYAASLAARILGEPVVHLDVCVSRNILKNAMGVGIPGTRLVGLPIAAALGALSGDADSALSVLCDIQPEDVEGAQRFLDGDGVRIMLSDTDEKLYIDVTAQGDMHTGRAVIRGAHTNVTLLSLDDVPIAGNELLQDASVSDSVNDLTLEEIDAFVRTVDPEQLDFLRECIDMNQALALAGLEAPYGIALGSALMQRAQKRQDMSEEAYAAALTCAAADARMGGCSLPAMSCCGSGNQGLTATLPIIAVCIHRKTDEITLLRTLAYSILVTIHVKQHLGKLSALCACSVGASIGTACALTYLDGGSFGQICHCIDNVVADVSGVICDGAKAGCSLKIATGVASAFRASMLALNGRSAAITDGIVGADAEATVDNLANLCNTGMADTDRVILDMLVCK